MQIGGSESIGGYKAAEYSLAQRGDRIAKTTTAQATEPVPSESTPPAKATDITSDLVGLNTDRLAGTYNLKALKVQDRMLGEVLDILK